MQQMALRNVQHGFSIIELMIAMTLSLTLAAAIVTVFVNNSYSFNQDENFERMQDDARHALREIAYDLSMAGFYGDLHVPASVLFDAGLSITGDCGPTGEANWMYRAVETGTTTSLSVSAIDNAAAANVVAAHSCFGADEIQPGTDVVAIKRVAGAEATATTADSAYLRTNGTVGVMFSGTAPTGPPVAITPPSADWEFRPSIYFIRPFANAPGDNIPTLCRKVLRGAGPSMITECLATGIEDLQIEYGIDTTDDGRPNVYMSNPALADMQTVVSARIFLLARTTETDNRYTNNKTYSISNAPDFTPGDSFHRRVFSTSVSVQNIRSLNMMAI